LAENKKVAKKLSDWESNIRYLCQHKSVGDNGVLHCERLDDFCQFNHCPARKEKE